MQTEYSLTLKDYRAAQWLYLKHHPIGMLFYVSTCWIMPIIGALSMILGLITRGDNQAAAAVFRNLGPFLGFFILFPVLREWTLRRGYAAIFPKRTPVPITFSFDDLQFISAIPGVSEGRFRWSALEEYAENSKIALLFVAKKRFLMVPKNALPEESWTTLRALAKKA